MTSEIYAKIIVSDTEKQRIKDAIVVMNDIVNALGKTGIESCRYAIDDLNDGICQLYAILEEKYW